jgi:hypothetical protein
MQSTRISVYDLTPITSQKSFYGKAKVVIAPYTGKTLFSYETPIVTVYSDGRTNRIVRHYKGWTPTTGKHINSFIGLRKKEFSKLPYETYKGYDLDELLSERVPCDAVYMSDLKG